jgi:type IV secretory pathway VirB2 component (pilin)
MLLHKFIKLLLSFKNIYNKKGGNFMKTLQKVLLMLVFVASVMVVLPNNMSMAASPAETAIGEIESATAGTSNEGTTALAKVVKNILSFLQIASGLVAVIMIAVTGFRYIIETPDMKQELKKSMIPIVVGILLVFFATTIAKFFIGIFSNAS